jgi:nucleoside permease NupC
MLETGIMVFLGVALILWKLPRRAALRLLNHDLAIDVTVTMVTLVVHWGTFSGVMAATVAGLLTSLATSGAKRLFGYIRASHYHPGVFHVKVDLHP